MLPKYKILILLCCFCVVVFSIQLQSEAAKPKGYLTEKSREKYKDVKYSDIMLQPRKYRNKKLKMKWVFNGESSNVRHGYSQKMTQRRYYYFRHAEDREEYRDGKVHVMFSRKNKKKLLELLNGITEGTEILLYGKLKKLAINKKRYYFSSSTNPRYFYIDDIESDVVDQTVENAKNFKASDYKPVNAKTLDLVASKYIDQKISFTFNYNGREGQVDHYYHELFPSESYFQFETDYYSDRNRPNPLRGFALIASKKNMGVIDVIVELTEGEKITVYGTLKKYVLTGYSSPRTKYYILVDSIKKAGANEIPAVPKAPEKTNKKKRRRRR